MTRAARLQNAQDLTDLFVAQGGVVWDPNPLGGGAVSYEVVGR